MFAIGVSCGQRRWGEAEDKADGKGAQLLANEIWIFGLYFSTIVLFPHRRRSNRDLRAVRKKANRRRPR
jgi:hypothetical protein